MKRKAKGPIRGLKNSDTVDPVAPISYTQTTTRRPPERYRVARVIRSLLAFPRILFKRRKARDNVGTNDMKRSEHLKQKLSTSELFLNRPPNHTILPVNTASESSPMDSGAQLQPRPRGIYNMLPPNSGECYVKPVHDGGEALRCFVDGEEFEVRTCTTCAAQETSSRCFGGKNSEEIATMIHVDWDDLLGCERWRRFHRVSVTGPTLAESRMTYSDKEVPLLVALEIGKQLVALIEKLHSLGATHGDISPFNVHLRGGSLSSGLEFTGFQVPSEKGLVELKLRDLSRVILVMKELNSSIVPLVRSGQSPMGCRLRELYDVMRSLSVSNLDYGTINDALDRAINTS